MTGSAGAEPRKTAEQVYSEFRRRVELETGRSPNFEDRFERLCIEHGKLSKDLRFLHSIRQGAKETRRPSFRDVLNRRTGPRPTGSLRDGDENRTPAILRLDPAPSIEKLARSPNDRYIIERELGRGGMSEVHEVWDSDLQRRVAMKVQSSQFTRDDDATARFLDEASITSQLRHSSIVPVHDIGLDESGRLFFTMQSIKGKELRQVIDLARCEVEGWTMRRLLGVFVKICDAMAYAHARGVVHRDLKPNNIMVGHHGDVYVIDWGLSKVMGQKDRHQARLSFSGEMSLSTVHSRRAGRADVDPEDSLVTPQGTVVGTPVYMPPEQATGDVNAVNATSDVYSVGAMLYTALAGVPPYIKSGQRASPMTILAQVVEEAPTPIRSIDPNADPTWVAVCERAMSRKQDDRFADCRELSDVIRDSLDQVSSRRLKRNRRMSLLAIASLLAFGVLGWSLYFGHEELSVFPSGIDAEFRRLDSARAALWPLRSTHAGIMANWLEETDLALNRFDRAALASEDLTEFRSRAGDLRRKMTRVRARLEYAKQVRRRSIDEAWDTWQEAIRIVADKNLASHYSGYRLHPIEGLIPIGLGPRTGLMEFCYLKSGRVPVRGDDRILVLDKHSGIVFVLVPRPGVHPLLLSKYEMTRAQWMRITDAPTEEIDQDKVLVNVSWTDASDELSQIGLSLPAMKDWSTAHLDSFKDAFVGLDSGVVEWCADREERGRGRIILGAEENYADDAYRAKDLGLRAAWVLNEEN